MTNKACLRRTAAAHLVEESQARIGAMALVHEKLYQAEDLTRVDLPGYLKSVVEALRASYGEAGPGIDVEVTIEPLAFDLDEAVRCGLIVNELVSNGFKHAFRGQEQGQIDVSLEATGQSAVVLSVADNGVGLPVSVEPATAESLGLQLVHHLTQQLGGTVDITRRAGTTFRIQFSHSEQTGQATR